MRQLSVLVLLAALFCPAGVCQSTAQPAASAPSAASGTVCFYRLRENYAALMKPSVYIDGSQVGRMRNGRFFSVTVAAGKHTITSTLTGSGAIVDMKAGETYYVRLSMSRPALFHNARGIITLVDPSQGKFEASQLKPAEPEDTTAAATEEPKP